MWHVRVPPPPHPSDSLDWGGVRKNALQNLDPQQVRGHDFDNKELAGFLKPARPTAYALTMICFFLDRRKVRCHSAGVEKLKVETLTTPHPCKGREAMGHPRQVRSSGTQASLHLENWRTGW